jgi:Na+/alanine symporter
LWYQVSGHLAQQARHLHLPLLLQHCPALVIILLRLLYQFLLGVKAVVPFRVLWILAVPIGATSSLEFIWLLADTLNAMMAIPNLIALMLLSPVVFKLTKEYFSNQQKGDEQTGES